MTTPPEPNPENEQIATKIIYRLTGRRWSPPMRTTEIYELRTGQNRIYLSGRPVIDIESITNEGANVQLSYQLFSAHIVEIAGSTHGGYQYTRPQPCTPPRRIRITYTYGAPATGLIKRAIDLYREELDRFDVGDTACRLPKRVTNIQRQGMSMTILDPGDYIEKGLVGIPDIDSLITTINPTHARSQTQLYGPHNAPPLRISTHML